MPKSVAVKLVETAPEPSLRAAHKELTRQRIREAAKALFHQSGVVSTTMDQIAAAAGVSRPTVYVHFRDKEAVVEDIARAYAEHAQAVNRTFPGPEPTTAQIRAWLEDKVGFYREERISLSLLYQAGHGASGKPPALVRDLMGMVLETYAQRAPAFRMALESGPHQPHARVRAETLVRQVTWACEFCARDGLTPSHEAALDITAEAFAQLLDHFARLRAQAAASAGGA
jgi:AcrR family transcriptional regulator